MEPRIETLSINLVGVQAVISMDGSFIEQLNALNERLFAKVVSIPDVDPALRTIGYWQFIDNATRVHFAGVQVISLENFKWDYAYGLAAWSLGTTTWAMWDEPDGQEGSIVHGGVAWGWLDSSDYTFDARFLGDFEVYEWLEAGTKRKNAIHEIWIPIVRRS